MLTLTPTAAQAVQALVAHRNLDTDTGGLRISSGEAAEPGSSLTVAVVDRPEAADAEVESDGAHVFLEPAVSDVLADKVLDASIEAGRARFVLLAPGDAE